MPPSGQLFASEGFRQAVKAAGIARDGKRLSLHSLRDDYASLLIAKA